MGLECLSISLLLYSKYCFLKVTHVNVEENKTQESKNAKLIQSREKRSQSIFDLKCCKARPISRSILKVWFYEPELI